MGSKVEQYVHFVWSTLERRQLITAQCEQVIVGVLKIKCVEARCEAIAIGGTSDHVHVLAALHPTVSVAQLAGVMKGTTSSAVRRGALPLADFAWQSGYGAFSVGPREREAVERYIFEQKQRHAADRVAPLWEPPGDC
jgi:REP element-mobilizing transposase RayT